MFVTPGMVFTQNFVMQTQHYLSKWHPKLRDLRAKNEQLSGYYGQNKTRAWIQFATKLFKSLNLLIRKVYITWEGNSTCLCYPMTLRFCPADARIWQKMTHFWHICAQIISVCEFRVLQKHFKVRIDL